MADKKISQLTNLTGANLADNDEFVLVDTSADETKAITWSELKEGLDTGAGFVRITGDTMTGDLTVPNLITSGDVDGRDVSADGTKLDGIEANADVTDTANVTSALNGGTLSSLTITSVDINGGTIDGTVIGGSSPAAGSFTTGSFTGNVSFAGNTSYGDNDKAIFGAGSDLQIYHSGAGSYITEAGVGDLYIQASNLILEDPDGNNYFAAVDGGATLMYYNGSAKLATTSTGIDVTGQLVADSGQFDGNVNIDGTVTADGLTVDGDITINDSSPALFLYDTDGTNQRGLVLQSGADMSITSRNDTAMGNILLSTSDGGFTRVRLKVDGPTGDISFYEDTGTTPKFFWDASAESLGIGTSSPDGLLTVNNSAGGADFYILANDALSSNIYLGDQTSSIGAGRIRYNHSDNAMYFYTNGSEAMRIDSSGNLLVSQSSSTQPGVGNTTDGFALRDDGLFFSSSSAGRTGTFARNGSDGDILGFYKDGSRVGSIGASGGGLYIGNASGFRFDDGSNRVLPYNAEAPSTTDGTLNLGAGTSRFKDLYLSGGVYLGGTGSANYLDDYEEGTWTPLIGFGGASTGITYSTNFGSYTKIGRLVYINGVIILSSKGTASGSFALSGLPFNVGDILPGTSNGGSLNFHYFEDSTASYLYSFFQEGQSYASGLYPQVNHANELNQNDFGNTTSMRFNGVYVTS